MKTYCRDRPAHTPGAHPLLIPPPQPPHPNPTPPILRPPPHPPIPIQPPQCNKHSNGTHRTQTHWALGQTPNWVLPPMARGEMPTVRRTCGGESVRPGAYHFVRTPQTNATTHTVLPFGHRAVLDGVENHLTRGLLLHNAVVAQAEGGGGGVMICGGGLQSAASSRDSTELGTCCAVSGSRPMIPLPFRATPSNTERDVAQIGGEGVAEP